MQRYLGTVKRYRNTSIGMLIAITLVFLLSTGMVQPRATQDDQIGALGKLDQDGVPVLCYHYLRNNITPFGALKALGALCLSIPLVRDMDLWTLTRSNFERQMSILKENGYESIGLDDVVAWQRGQKELPEKSVVITFDDGDRSIYDVARPVLEKFGYKATIFVVTSRVGRRWDRVDMMTWAELRELQDSGVFTIESHSHALHYQVDTDEGRFPVFQAASWDLYHFPDEDSWQDAVFKDLAESRRLIKRHLGYESRFLAWPFGHASGPLDRIAVAAGFDGLCTLVAGKNPRTDYPLVVMDPSSLVDGWKAPVNGRSGTRRRAVEIDRYTMTARTSRETFENMIW